MRQRLARIVVVGSVNVDLIVRSERLPRPGETVVGGQLITAGGGKGANQAVAARRLGAAVSLVARVGRDGPGELALASFRVESLDPTWLTVDPEIPTGVALILVDRDGNNLISVAPGANLCLTPEHVREAAPAFAKASVLVTQLEVPDETVVAALALARSHRLTTILNPAPARPLPDAVLRLVDWLTPNETEAATLSGVPVDDRDSAIRAARRLLDRGVGRVVVTRGKLGAVLVTAEDVLDVPAFAVSSIDSVAAGDAFTAGLAVELARGQSPAFALRYASAAGALTTTRPGAQPALPTAAEVTRLLGAEPASGLAAVGAEGT